MFNKKEVKKLQEDVLKLEELRIINERFIQEFLTDLGLNAEFKEKFMQTVLYTNPPNIVAMQKGVTTLGSKIKVIEDRQQKILDRYSLAIQGISDMGKRFDAIEQYLGIEYKTLVKKSDEVKGYAKVKKSK